MAIEDTIRAFAREQPARFAALAEELGYVDAAEAEEERGAEAQRAENWRVSRALWGDHPGQPQQEPIRDASG